MSRDERVEIDAFLGQRDRRRHRRFLRLLDFGRQIVDVDLRSAGAERDGALDRVLELPHVARPVIRHQPAHRLLRDGRAVAAASARPRANLSRKCCTSSGMSSLRSRSGGSCTGMTFSR